MFQNLKILLEKHPLEIRLLIIASIAGVIVSVLTVCINIVLDLGWPVTLASLFAGVMSSTILYFATVRQSYVVPVYLGILAAILVIYPVMWVINAGSYGPMIYYMLFNALFCAVLLAYLNYKIILLLQLAVAYGLLALEHYMPQLITPYPDAVTRSIDIGFSFTLVFILIFYMSIKVMGEYNRSIKELEETKQELLNINGKLTLVSETDELTGVYNRRYIMNILRTQLLPKKCKLVSIIMLDIDHFKAINDTYGHSMGDEVLKNVSITLRNNIRKTDTLARIGGEEFLITLPNTALDVAYARAEILREAVAQLKCPNTDMQITISGGVYCKNNEETLDELLENVDKCLYTSKNAGRNRITA